MAPAFGVQLEECGSSRLAVLSKVRHLLRLTLTEVKSIVDAGPVNLTSGMSAGASQRLAAELRKLGATVQIYESSSGHEFDAENRHGKLDEDRPCSQLYSHSGDCVGYCLADRFTGGTRTYRAFLKTTSGDQWRGMILNHEILSTTGERVCFIFSSRLVWNGDLVGYVKDNIVFDKAGKCVATSVGNAEADAIAGTAYLLLLAEPLT